MKKPVEQQCRICGCTNEKSCHLVEKYGQRECQWARPDLCDAPQCLVEAANDLKSGFAIQTEIGKLRQLATQRRKERP